MSVDRTDELTEYEYEYEFLLDQAFKQIIQEAANNVKISSEETKFSREFAMDETEYEHIRAMADRGEEVDFEIPRDAPEGKRMSENVLGTANEDREPVNLEEIFPDA